jgi:hypothetical protein
VKGAKKLVDLYVYIAFGDKFKFTIVITKGDVTKPVKSSSARRTRTGRRRPDRRSACGFGKI